MAKRKTTPEPESEKSEKRALPPVSKARGGLWSGIDLNDGASLHEIEDLDYARRLLIGRGLDSGTADH